MKSWFKVFLTLFLLLTLATFSLTGCGLKHTLSRLTAVHPSSYSRTNLVLGTVATITLYDGGSDAVLNEAFAKLKDLEDILSINKTGTLIDEINANAGIKPVAVDADTYMLIKTCLSYGERTNGNFDLTVGPLVKLWHIGFPDAKIPTKEEIDSKLPLVNYQLVHLDDTNHTVYLPKSGMCIDLGGIGKGYAADELTKLLSASGVKSGTISLGGNVYAMGERATNKPWTIGIQDPFSTTGNSFASITASNRSLVTSGIYERYIEDDNGHFYHHILNPKTGYPFYNELAGVTIISRSSTDGDALSTSTFSLGLKEGMAFIEQIDDVDAIFVTKDKEVYLTSGIKDHFKLLSPDFTLIP